MRNSASQTQDAAVAASERLLQPIRATHLKDEAYRRLKSAIVSLQIPPGTPLVEARVAEQLSVSKTPVRHALIRLEKEGFVRTIPSRGTFVHHVTHKDIRELFELREALECAAARLAIERADGESLDGARVALEETGDAVARDAFERAFAGIQFFHLRMIDAAKSPRIAAAFRDIDAQMERIRIIAGHIPGRLHVSIAEHRRILEAVEERDARAADDAVRYHLASLLGAYLDAVRSTETVLKPDVKEPA